MYFLLLSKWLFFLTTRAYVFNVKAKQYQIMHTVAILGFFSLVIVFFFTGRNDFGLKPTPRKNDVEKLNEVIE